MARPIWSGTISFGLVNIPIRLHNAIKNKNLHFHQLRKKDGCRIRLKKVCSTDGAEVMAEDIVKGYEVSPDQYVVVSSEELTSVTPKASRSIEIEDFVLMKQIDPIYFEKSYYLIPEPTSMKAYRLLLEAMETSKRVAVAKFVLRNKQYLAVLRPNGQTITLSTLFFADEIISPDELSDLAAGDTQPTEKELKIALQLVESLSNDFQPEKYHDEYREKVLNLIKNKAEGETVTAPAQVQNQPGKIIDLMAALEASVSAIKKQKTSPKRKRVHALQNKR
ncbi:putative DNA repair protein AnaeK_1024 [Propionispora sp. 2/2-37]|uniref:non-homologous end joining protein Ku n=1 Tax=Propionispora sp. 2/2-37 TaxID=1677858 RepID=UPI0006BB8E52|nr:Ku protein [Propionispora sp. 2/2-37]CUH96991.1 putative DNA repair protein AnaeK_1024 [Propionispora sp. 2/2-37]